MAPQGVDRVEREVFMLTICDPSIHHDSRHPKVPLWKRPKVAVPPAQFVGVQAPGSCLGRQDPGHLCLGTEYHPAPPQVTPTPAYPPGLEVDKEVRGRQIVTVTQLGVEEGVENDVIFAHESVPCRLLRDRHRWK